jgi:hypothetical protein
MSGCTNCNTNNEYQWTSLNSSEFENCTECFDVLQNDEMYGYNYLKYGPNFQYYMIPEPINNVNSNGLQMQQCYTEAPQNVGRWRVCNGPYVKLSNQKKIWNSVRVPASEYTMNKASLTVYNGLKSWNRPSDRNEYSNTTRNVPSHGNSTKKSLTRMRPGACSAPGKGVDIKHNSYDRYLAKLKGKGPLRSQKQPVKQPIKGNKTKYYGIAYSNSCFC